MYSMHVSPVTLDCNFVVDNTNANGVTSLKGPTIQAVYMNSAAATPNALNPAAGTIVVQFQDNYNGILTGAHINRSANSGSPLTATTDGVPVTITSLGTATTAQWRAVGLPTGITPAVGVSFVPTSSATIGGSAAVQIAAATGCNVASIEILGNPTLTANPNPNPSGAAPQGYGAYMILQCRDYAGAIAAPTAGSTITLSFLMSNSSIQVQGE